MEPIKPILDKVIEGIQKKQQQNPNDKIENIWVRCVKKNIAQHTKVRLFKKGKLYVNAESPVWLYELKIKKDGIAQRLQKLSKNKIKEVRFRVGDIHGS